MIDFILYSYVLQGMMCNNVATSHGHSLPLMVTVLVLVSLTVLSQQKVRSIVKYQEYIKSEGEYPTTCVTTLYTGGDLCHKSEISQFTLAHYLQRIQTKATDVCHAM